MAGRAGGAIGIAGVHHDGAHFPFRGAQMLLGNQNCGGNHQILCEDSRSGSGHIARKDRQIQRASLLQQAVAAKRNPRGSAASERACFMSATFRSPFQSAAVRPLFQLAAPRPSFQSAVFRSPLATATSVALAPRSRKGPPILRSGGESVKLTCGLHAHGLAPVLVAFLLRRASKSAMAARTDSAAVPPATFFAASAASTLWLPAKSAAKAGEI